MYVCREFVCGVDSFVCSGQVPSERPREFHSFLLRFQHSIRIHILTHRARDVWGDGRVYALSIVAVYSHIYLEPPRLRLSWSTSPTKELCSNDEPRNVWRAQSTQFIIFTLFQCAAAFPAPMNVAQPNNPTTLIDRISIVHCGRRVYVPPRM